ncbi:MAG: hypothetical protein H8Z69_02140 [Nanohaloarchaea archaeon]|nr:hypothetical protein [Candidatus Nanohaloarchaea archaeon]
MKDELQQTVEQHLDEALEQGAGVSEKTEGHFEYGFDTVKFASDMTPGVEIEDVERLYEVANDVAEGEGEHSLVDGASAVYGGAVHFANAVENAQDNSLDKWRSVGRAVVDSIATIYEQSDGAIHDVIFSSEQRSDNYAEALMGDEDSQGLLNLVNYESQRAESKKNADDLFEENKQMLEEAVEEYQENQ